VYTTAQFNTFKWSEFVQNKVYGRYTNNINQDAVKLVEMFMVRPNRQFLAQQHDNAEKLVKDVGVKLIKNCTQSALAASNIYNNMMLQWSAFTRNDPPYLVTIEEDHLYKDNDVRSAVTFWTKRFNMTTTDELSVIALALLNINPSEASVERSFSRQNHRYVTNCIRRQLKR